MGEILVDLDLREVDVPLRRESFEAFVFKVLEQLSVETGEVSLLICNDEFITKLNSRYRGKDGPTDVLSFSQNEGYDMGKEKPTIFGDIVVSCETIERQAEEFGVSREEELKRVVLHGILHLMGMDHTGTDVKQEPMLRKQEELLSLFREVRLF